MRQGIIHAAQGKNKKPREIRSEDHKKYWSLWYPYASILTVIDIIWEVSRRVDFSSIRAPVMLVGSRIDPVISWGASIGTWMCKWRCGQVGEPHDESSLTTAPSPPTTRPLSLTLTEHYKALAGPKLCLTLEPRALENQVLCSRILSHDSVDEVVPVMIEWVRAKRTAPVFDPAVGLKE